MPWFKVDDSFHSHPKVMATEAAALGLWVIAGSWCSANLTDGFVPDHVLPRLLPGSAKLAKKLIAAGLWVRAERGYLFHDWQSFNPTAEQVKADRASTAERQRRFRENRNTVTNGVSNGVTNGVSHSAPTRPDPAPSSGADPLEGHVGKGGPGGTPPRQRGRPPNGTRIPDDFAVTDEMVAWARQHTPHVDGRRETAAFVDHWRSKTGRDGTKLDWIATWRNWMRKAANWSNASQPHPSRPSTTDQRVADIQALKGRLSDDPSALRALPGGAS